MLRPFFMTMPSHNSISNLEGVPLPETISASHKPPPVFVIMAAIPKFLSNPFHALSYHNP